jgi:chemotaxis response regulator CheB
MNSKKNIRIIIASRPGAWQRFLQNDLSSYPSVEVVGISTGSLTTLQLSKEHQPDIVLIDASIPPEEAIAIIKSIKLDNPTILTVVIADTKNQQQKLVQSGTDHVLSTYEFKSKIKAIFSQSVKISTSKTGRDEESFEINSI